MLQDCRLIDFGERLTSLLRAAVLPAALSSLCYASSAPAAEHNAPAATPPAPPAEEAALPDLPANLQRLPAPAIAPPVNHKKPAAVHVELEARPVTGLLAEEIGYLYLIYNCIV